MYDFHYTRLLEDSTSFQPQAGNTYVEFTPGENGLLEISESHIEEADISEWIIRSASRKSDGPRPPVLTLLIGSPEEHYSDAKILPLPVSRTTFEVIRTEWNMPTELLRMMLSSLPLVLPFTSQNSCGQVLEGLVVRCARSRDWNFCVAVVHNTIEATTCAILIGMQESEVDKLLTCMRFSMQHVGDPMLLPIFLLELRTNYFALLLEKRAVGIEEIEYQTGMRGFTKGRKTHETADLDVREKLKLLDFHSITQKLTGATGTLSFCNLMFESNKKALDLVASYRARIRTRQWTSDANKHAVAADAVDRRIHYLRELITGSQALGEVLAARTKAQVQTVYSLIGQRDNMLNIDIAEAAKETAETSLLHNASMTTIAEDSRNVAILTRRDSVDMRIIATMTLVFLPGQYISSVFSNNMFQFFPTGSDAMVSKWIWLYWVLNILVTSIVLVAWWQFSKRQNFDSKLDESRLGSKFVLGQTPAQERRMSGQLAVRLATSDVHRTRTRSTGSVPGFDYII